MRGVIGVVVLVMGWVLPGVAAADDATCSYNAGNRTVTVDVTASDDFAPSLLRNPAGAILVVDADGPVPPCGGTVNNTDTIVINNAAGQPLEGPFYINYRSPFAPGFTNEPGSSDEIEFVVNFAPGGRLGLDVRFSTSDIGSPMHVTMGGNLVNLNADEADGIDADVTMNGVTSLYLSRGGHDNTIIGSGGGATPDVPVGVPMEVTGNLGGNDLIIGGSADDRLYGLAGLDLIDGGGGNDLIIGDGGAPTPTDGDMLTGGPGRDNILGQGGNDVIAAGPGRDSVEGGEGDDLAIGHGGRDVIIGDAGNDVLRGKGGRDTLLGKDGDDRLDGGGGKDRCVGGPGKDTLKRCEAGKA